MSLQKIATEMQEVATKNPHMTMVNPICPTVCFREIQFGGQKIEAVFSLDVWPEREQWWHLTITPERDLRPDEEEEILTAFFGIGGAQLPVMGNPAALRGKLLEMTKMIKESAPPGMIPPRQRQFMKLI